MFPKNLTLREGAARARRVSDAPAPHAVRFSTLWAIFYTLTTTPKFRTVFAQNASQDLFGRFRSPFCLAAAASAAVSRERLDRF